MKKYKECPTCGNTNINDTIFKCNNCNHFFCEKCKQWKQITSSFRREQCPKCNSTECQQIAEIYFEEQQKCFYCGQADNLVSLHGEYFHIKCKNDFLEKEEGKLWLAEQEKRKKQYEALKIENEKKSILDQQRSLDEENEKKEKELEEQKNSELSNIELKKERKLINLIRPVIFIIFSLLAITYKNSLEMILNGRINFIVSWLITLVLFYFLLGAVIGSAYDTIKKAKEKYSTLPVWYYISVFFSVSFFIGLFWCLIYLILHFLVKLF